MKYKNIITLLTSFIIVLSLITAAVGIFSGGGSGKHDIKSFRGETITLYGKGIYKKDSVSVAAQGRSQDVVTLVMGIPLLGLALYLARRNSLRGSLLLTGTLGYFLYTYVSYTFLSMYNRLFLVYVMLMSASFFAFTLSMLSYDIRNLSKAFNKKLPVKFLGGFQLFFAVAIAMMWIGRISPSLVSNSIPQGIEHYTTLVIQGMDLGFIVPVALISGVLLIRRKQLGYLLSSVVIMKGMTMATALTAMIVGQYMEGVKMNAAEMLVFPIINVIIIYCMILIMKNIDEDKYTDRMSLNY